MLELSEKEFKIIILNVKDYDEKIREHSGTDGYVAETNCKNQRKFQKFKANVKKINRKNALMDLSVD